MKGITYNLLAEGYYTADAIHRLAEKHGVDMPICEAVYNILYNGVDYRAALDELFARTLKKELH